MAATTGVLEGATIVPDQADQGETTASNGSRVRPASSLQGSGPKTGGAAGR
jgi:hypothetical protein